MNTQYFDNYQPKLKFEAILRSALCGLAVGCAVNFLVGAIFWFTGVELFLALIGILVGVSVAAGFAFYFLRFKPTDVSSARRLDALGLKERMVTMVEFDHVETRMAQIQREDAKAALSKVDKSLLKVKISRGIAIALAICAFLGVGMTTVNILTELGIIQGGDDIIQEIVDDQLTVYVTLTYEIEDGGILEGGDEIQIIPLGSDGVAVTAVADEGYMFQEWSDGLTNPTRTDRGVKESVTYTAIFVEVEEEGEEGDEEGNGNGDQAGDAPGDEAGDGEGDSPSNGEPNPEGSGSGGKSEPNNQIVDGKTFYREVLEYYQDLANGTIEAGEHGLTEEEIAIIKRYLGIV